ncbi:GNAT family N-acetyltransferase [Streptomyces sp. NPDC093060]|uniref:GNAT family N-acetyltransferase n=1 Tax=Streptomyces sp. NPDC093060 TaxID=3366019 RepID=UPI003830451D
MILTRAPTTPPTRSPGSRRRKCSTGAGTTSGSGTGTGTGSSGATAPTGSSGSAGSSPWNCTGSGYWVVRCHGSDRQLGFCGVKPMELHGERVLNLFYRFAASAWGQGFAGEAAAAVTAWAHRHLPDLPLIARIRPANVASQRVALRAGLGRAQHLDTEGYDGFDWIYVAQPEHWALTGH